MSNIITHDFNGISIAFQGKEMINLTDLWKASGSQENRDPRQWRRKEGASFIEALTQTLNVPENHIIKSSKGKGGGTWAHWQNGLQSSH